MYEPNLEDEVLRYLPLVKRVVQRIDIKSNDYELDDLINIGVIGLMDALKKYDATKKASFETYAYIRIRGTVIDEVRKTSRVSRNRMDQLNAYYRAKEVLETEKKQEVSEREICKKMGISEKELRNIHETLHYLANVSLEDTLFSSSDEEMTVQELIADEEAVPADDLLVQDEQKLSLTEAISQLKERDQLILNLYYVEELTLKEIAKVIEVSVPRVSQLHGKIILKLKSLMEDKADD